LANYIRCTKRDQAPLVCPLEGSCETVVHSEYSKLFGIPLEYIGMAYYGLITLFYLLFAFIPQTLPTAVLYFILSLTVAAFAFSIYLTAVQAFVLKHWCTWCLCSAMICTAIFILVIYLSDLSLKEIFTSLTSLL